jgi:hypothetical protein
MTPGRPPRLHAVCQQYVFEAGTDLGTVDTGNDHATGRFSFGPPPGYLPAPCLQPQGTMKAMGWRPIIASIGYRTLGTQDPYAIAFWLVGDQTPVAGVYYAERFAFATTDLHLYAKNVPVPVVETTGNPYALQVVTTARTQAASLVVDWQWGWFVHNISADELRDVRDGR